MNEVILQEVGLRDGLQAEKQTVPFEHKAAWVGALIESGVDVIQLGSFVNPEKVPQMADTDKLFQQFSQPGAKPSRVRLSGLVLNEKGLDRGQACGVELFCMGVSASETHSQKNTGMTVADAAARIIQMARAAVAAGREVQVSVQSAFGCGFEGAIPETRVLDLVKRYLDAGVRMVSLADTAGHANPAQVERLFGEIRTMGAGIQMAAHFHNTYGMGLANCMAAMRAGATYLESAFGGLGGCPFTKLPAGNVCTEDLVHLLQQLGQRPEVDLARLIGLAKEVAAFFNRELPGFVYKSGPIKH